MRTLKGLKKIYHYTDYRTFLKDYFELQKSSRSSWSFSVWARAMRLKSPSTLIMLVHGQRNPGPKLIKQLISYFDFNHRESEYFTNLIKLQKVNGDPSLSVLFMEKLAKDHASSHFVKLNLDTFSAISDWYYYAIRQLTLIDGFREDANWIASQLHYKVTARQIKHAIQTMLKLGLLKHGSEGRIHKSEEHLETSNDVESEALKRFHEQMLENTKAAIRLFPASQRENSGVTLAMRAADIPKAKALIQKFQDELCQIFEQGKPDSVFHLEVGLIPISVSAERSKNV